MSASAIRFHVKTGSFPARGVRATGGACLTSTSSRGFASLNGWRCRGVEEIRECLGLHTDGDSTIGECRRIVYERRAAIDSRLKELKLARDFIECKCWFCDLASEADWAARSRRGAVRTAAACVAFAGERGEEWAVP